MKGLVAAACAALVLATLISRGAGQPAAAQRAQDSDKPKDGAVNHRIANWIGDRLGWPSHVDESIVPGSAGPVPPPVPP